MASSTSLQVAGLASNFDWKSFVDQIMAVEHTPADRLAAEKATNQKKADMLSTLGNKLTGLQKAAQALKVDGLFGQRSASLSTSGSTWSTSAAIDTAPGTYKVAVSQLATVARRVGTSDVGSGLNPSSDSVAGLTVANLPIGQAVSAGTFTVNGQQVSVALTDSLDTVFAAISTATDGDVTAAYDHTTDKITLTSATTDVTLGAVNDTSNFLRALKLGNNGTGTVSSSARLGTVKTTSTLATANLGTAITAVNGSGDGSFKINGVSIAYNVNSDTISSVLSRINDSSAGVTAAYDPVNDRFSLTNDTTGDLGIAVSETAGGLLGAMGLTTGATLSRGKNAEFRINDGDLLSSASNTLEESALGVTGLKLTVASEDTQTVTVSANTDTMKSKIQTFIDKFNDVQDYLDESTKITSGGKGKVTAAALSNNREIQDWGRSLRTLAFSAVAGASGISRLENLGLDFVTGTSKLQIADETKLVTALRDKSSAVTSFFNTSTTGFAAKFDSFVTKISNQNDDQQKNLDKGNASIDDQIAAIERRLEQQRSVMESAFIQMETAQSKLKNQQSALTNAFSSTKSG